MKNKFGKKSLDILSIKKDFFINNRELLKKQKKILTIYKKQPLRKLCKICKKKFANTALMLMVIIKIL